MFTPFRSLFRKETLRDDAIAGLVLGVQSIPDGLAGGLLAGVNPVYGLYAYMFGMFSAAFATSSVFMTVQATGAMAAVIADVPQVHAGADPSRALFTLSLLTGIVMLAAGLLKLGSVLRYVSNSVMVGFLSAVGINIVLGQLNAFTGYNAAGYNRLSRTLDLLLHPFAIHPSTITIGIATIVLILLLERTRLGALGMVVAVIVTSAAVPLLGSGVARLKDFAEIPNGLPLPTLPMLQAIPELILPAFSLAFIGLVQGAGISANFPNPDGTYPDASRDFIGQGVGNLVSGIFQGMPVGGSMSATALIKTAKSKSPMCQIFAAVYMAVVILLFGNFVGYIAMPALAGLLIIIGVRTVKPERIFSAWKTGRVQAVVMFTTLVLTILIPLQYAVVVGIGISMILYVVYHSNDLVLKRFVLEEGKVRQFDPPQEVPAGEVIVLQPFGSLFFASATKFEKALPTVTARSRNSVIILRLRGRTDLGSTLTDILARFARSLQAVNSRLVIVTDSQRVLDQLAVTGVTDLIGQDNIYISNEWIGKMARQAYDDACQWVLTHRGDDAGCGT